MVKKFLYMISDTGACISGLAVITLMLLTVTSIILRLARIPSTDFYELTTLFGLILFVSGWAYAQKEKSHLRVKLITARLPQRVQSIIEILVNLLSVFIAFFMVIFTIIFAIKLYVSGRIVSQNFELPIYILVSVIAFFMTLYTLILVLDLYDSLLDFKESNKT